MNAHAPNCSCPACSAENAGIPESETRSGGACLLKDIPDGVRTHVQKLRGGRQLRSRLHSLGFTPGTEITVHGQGDAGCRVLVRDTCIVLDCDSAGNILCDEIGHSGTTATL